jgi:hypothetical protein
MNYLQDQAVMNFAGTAARGSAIGTAVSQGMVSYLNDTNFLQVYDNNGWHSVAGVQVVAGTAVRNSLIPTPNQGDTVFRNDTGLTETYYAAAGTANPGGATPADWYPMPRLLFAASATRSLVSGTSYTAGATGFSYTKQLDLLGWQNPSVNPDRITPKIAGFYRITVAYDASTINSVGVRQVQVQKNNVTVPGGFISVGGATSNYLNLNGSFIVSMNGSTDELKLAGILQNSGSSITAEVTVAIEYLRPNA